MSKTSGLELGELIGEGITGDEAKLITEKIESIVEARLEAKLEIEKELIESETKEKYDTILAEKTQEFESKVTSLEESFVAKVEEFKTTLTEETQEKVSTFKDEKEAELETFVEGIIEKLDEYLDLEISKALPDDQIENSAKIAVLEPIVHGFKSVMQENYIKFDEEQFGLLKESRSEILKLRDQLAESVKDQMDMNKSFKSLEKDVKISKVCEGLTESQRERASKLLEGCDASEVEKRFSMIRDMVITEEKSSNEEYVAEEVEETQKSASGQQVDKVISEEVEIDTDVVDEEIVESVSTKDSEISEYASIFKSMRK